MTIAAYRLVKRKYATSAFDGEGAHRHGGRWNSKGLPCLYLAGSESLALLEVLVHLEDARLLRHYTLYRLALPDELVTELPADQLPANWQAELAPVETAAIGDAWLTGDDEGLALAVPSAVAPRDRNYLVWPEHPALPALIEAAEELTFAPDTRLR